jgi:hypothetical protein
MRRLSNNEEQQAQHIACSHLVRGCEGAVSELLAPAGASEGPSPAKKRAGEILAQVLSSWRDTRTALRITGEPATGATAAGDLGGWTGDELFAEALTRSAGDPPALRLMGGGILRALLTAHDGGVAAAHLAG